MPQYSDWYPMTRLPDYDGPFQLRTAASTIEAIFANGA